MNPKQIIPSVLMLLILVTGYVLGNLTSSTAVAQPADSGYHITSNADGNEIYIWEWYCVRGQSEPKSMTVWKVDGFMQRFTKTVIPLEQAPKEEKK